MKGWEIVADNLKKAGLSSGWVSALDSQGRTIWIVDAHRDGKRFVVRADEKLTAFLELDWAMSGCSALRESGVDDHVINCRPVSPLAPAC
jgi:hypothetical protein